MGAESVFTLELLSDLQYFFGFPKDFCQKNLWFVHIVTLFCVIRASSRRKLTVVCVRDAHYEEEYLNLMQKCRS